MLIVLEEFLEKREARRPCRVDAVDDAHDWFQTRRRFDVLKEKSSHMASSNRPGLSRYPITSLRNLAAIAPSMIRWS